jgi:tRNA nucleotidyltransferase (CCA-adding enzyme)
MSDYMFNLESHLTAEQNAALSAVQSAAAEANLSLYLTGGALRDMLGGFAIRDLDFSVEGPALKLARDVAKGNKAELLSIDEHRKSAELRFASGVVCEISMARLEKYAKPGSKPTVTPATIHEDLRRRDFTVNAIALSLNRASRGLMIDPTNGVSDLEHKEIRAITNYTLYDDPVRLLRLIRYRARLQFTINERTWQQFLNAREAGVTESIQPRSLFGELKQIATENDPLEVLKALDEEKLLTLFCGGLTGEKLNAAAFQKITKLKSMIPFGSEVPTDWYALNLWCLTQPLTTKEKAALVEQTGMTKEEAEPWQKLESRSKKLEGVLKAPKLNRASVIWQTVKAARGEEVFLLSLKSSERLVQDRLKNYFGKYLVIVGEITDAEVTDSTGVASGAPEYAAARETYTIARLDGRIKKPIVPEPEPEPLPQPRGPFARSAKPKQV